ncbi:MAG: VOC family protein [Bdellovibrionales bacterium]|nr:VOC family protein [Bdellovibrionales bacterium]
MAQQIYINLPVKNLSKAMQFFTHIGFAFNLKFTNATGACMIVGENIYVMLLAENFFRTFTTKSICDAKESTEVLICISAESRESVDEMITRARQAGGAVTRQPQDHGFMYGHGFEDLDGHIWEVIYMDPSTSQKL